MPAHSCYSIINPVFILILVDATLELNCYPNLVHADQPHPNFAASFPDIEESWSFENIDSESNLWFCRIAVLLISVRLTQGK